jgi:hypothetical protein
MTMLRRLLAGAAVLLMAAVVWMWWTRPIAVEMSSYVPADALIYFEAHDLPGIARALGSADVLGAVPPERRRGLDWASTPWVQRFLSFTGLGPHRAVVLARSQVAIAVLGFDVRRTGETGEGGSLRFSPRLALVAETHTAEWRVRQAVEQLAGDLARRSYGAPTVERKEIDGVPFIAWVSPSDPTRRIVAAVAGSAAFVGNDEAAVRACLEVRRGARQNFAADGRLGAMRERVGGEEGRLAFGYAPQGSAAKVVEILAPVFAGGIGDDTRVQSLLATLLPQVVDKVIGDAGWGARLNNGRIEDTYFVSVPGGAAQRLEAPFTPFASWGEGGAALLPADTFQLTQYNFRSPELAWRGFGATLSSQLDIRYATVLTLALEALVKPYGVAQPREFLRAVGPDIVTARLTKESERKILIVEAFDREALGAEVRKHLGPRASTERIGEAELIVSADPELGAAAFVAGHLLMGDTADVRRCLAAAADGRTLRSAPPFKLLSRPNEREAAFTRTLADDAETLALVVPVFTEGAGGALEAPAESRYSLSETRLTRDGFEKKTRSAFGLFGEIVKLAAPRR